MPQQTRSERTVTAKGKEKEQPTTIQPQPEDRSLPVLPVRDTVLFPHAVLPLTVGRESSVQLINSLGEDKTIIVIAQREARVDAPQPTDLYSVGSLAVVHKVVKMPNQSLFVFAEGLERVRLSEFTQLAPFMRARVDSVAESVPPKSSEVEALQRNVLTLFQQIVAGSPTLSDELSTVAMNIEEPGRLVDFIASSLPSLSTADKQDVLETTDVRVRLEKINQHLAKELEVQQLRNKIQSEVQDRVQQTQREYYLREQMKAIQKELGEQDEGARDTEELRQKIENAGMPDEVKKEALKELGRLSRMSPMAADYSVTRNYIEWLAVLPWAKTSGGEIEIPKAKEILDTDHYDLQKVKDRILDYLSVRRLKPGMKGPILCFVGPPGVGKTSLGKSIARALSRKFVRIALGGMHDEAEIRGHPSSALMEVLDPEQNSTFRDHYLDVPFDLSKVTFIATANWMDPIPEPLRDRMEIIELPGYTGEEKLHIAHKYLIPKQASEHGLKVGEQIEFTEAGLQEIIHSYTREAGVRNLEREIATITRKQARRLAEGKTEKMVVEPEVVREFLGVPKFRTEKEIDERVKKPGVAVGLVWTPVGGDIVFIEASRMRGGKQFTMTGHLGEVMQESMTAALTWVRSNAERYGIDPNFFQKHDIHIHVPSGAVQKDGPSAGAAMVTALVSLLTGRPIRNRLAMTGEMTLSGVVLPVGGIKEKVLGAKRAGVKEVLLPADNEPNAKADLPPELLGELKITYVHTLDEVLQNALEKEPVAPPVVPPTAGSKSKPAGGADAPRAVH